MAIAAGCDNPRALNGHPDVDACKAATTPLTIPTWTGGALRLRYAAEGAAACPAPKRVFIDADAGKGLRFIQIVEVNVAAPTQSAAGAPQTLASTPESAASWTFLDASPDVRNRGEPFVNANSDGTFWDNPAWLDVPARDQVWTARSYAVVARDDVDDSGHPVHAVGAVGGFSWGWTWQSGAPMPVAVAPALLSSDTWAKDRALLAKAFSAYRFE